MNIKLKLVLIAIIIPVALYLWPSALGGDTEFLMVKGESMLPTILPGSMVVAQASENYQIDDIVVFEQRVGRSSQLIVHRIIEETDRGFIIKGDNNPGRDAGYHSNDDILGKVIFSTPYIGDALAFLRNPVVLIGTGIVMAIIQMEQGRRKKKNEKLRRIRLGLPLTPPKQSQKSKKQKKPDYTLFFTAIAFNVITYVTLQVGIASNIRPPGDVLTGFLFKILEPSFASTVIFSFYSVFILGLYFMAKVYEVKSIKTSTILSKKSKSKIQLLVGKDSNPMLAVASFLWVMFVLMSLFHLLAIGNDLSTVIT